MTINDLVNVTRAIELLHYGVDITQLDSLTQYYNPKTKSLQSRISDNIEDFCVKYTPEVFSYIEFYLGEYIVRHGSSFFEIFEDSLTDEEKALNRIEVGIKEFKQVMTVLKDKGFAQFAGFNQMEYDSDYQKKMEEIRKHFDYTAAPTCSMVKELDKSSTRQNFEVLVQLCKYPYEVGEAMIKAYDKEVTDFGLKSLEKFPIIDNRMYIRISSVDKDELSKLFTNVGQPLPRDLHDLEYVVISRNPYDFYFCGYGSNVQSCYSLNSTHKGWYGFMPLSQFDGTYCIYGTSGKANRINLISGTKWNVPRMLYRCWGWKSVKGELMLDRVYIGEDAPENRRKIINTWFQNMFLKYNYDFNNHFNEELVSSKEYLTYFKQYSLRFYPDSLNFSGQDAQCYYKGICHGDRTFVGGHTIARPLLEQLRNITAVDENFHYSTQTRVVGGVLKSIKICPMTKLPISPEQKVSEFAYMFKEPVNNVVVVTYLDGFFHIDVASQEQCMDNKITYTTDSFAGISSNRSGDTYNFTPRFSSPEQLTNLKTFKETLKSAIAKCSDIDAVIVRYIDGENVTYVKYRR